MFLKSLHSKSRHRWVILYWIPYDNNLVRFGEPIIKMLAEGTRDSEVVVSVQSDYFSDPKMRRRILINGAIQEIDIVGEDSSNISAFSTFLDWANQTFDAEHWAVIVVGHGGKINEISPNEHGSIHQATTWMRVDQFASEVTQFNQSTEGRVELLFFQNCNKATLEVVYEASNINQESHEFGEFTEFVQSSVITYYKTGGKLFGSRHFKNINLNKLCGLNLYLPENGQSVSRYISLALYKQVDLLGLYRGIFVS